MEKQREQTLQAVFNIWRIVWIRLDDWKNVQIEKIQFLLIIFSVCMEECALATCTHVVQLLQHNVTSTPLHLSDRYKYSDLDFKYKTESFFSLNDPKMDRK